jgi:biotin operon repressor
LLEGHDVSQSYQQIGEALQMSENAVKVAAHRLRSRYRQLLREEVGRTVADPAEIEEEIADLLRALS